MKALWTTGSNGALPGQTDEDGLRSMAFAALTIRGLFAKAGTIHADQDLWTDLGVRWLEFAMFGIARLCCVQFHDRP
jgi:hypothetical protein